MGKGEGRNDVRWCNRALTGVLVIAFILGVGIFLYPFVSNWWNQRVQSSAIAGYTEQVETLAAADTQSMLDEARAYNEGLASLPDRFHPSTAVHARYEAALDVADGIMGYVEVPRAQIELPIYHGTGAEELTAGIGHIEGSSLPVGGEGTHAAISGHRGLPRARLFTDIDKLAVGDRFYLHVLDQTLAYEVDRIRIVEPDDVSELQIEPGADLCTLVTCTPYGVNTHRLLVRGHRVEATSDALRVSGDAVQIDSGEVAFVVCGVCGCAIAAVAAVCGVRRRLVR